MKRIIRLCSVSIIALILATLSIVNIFAATIIHIDDYVLSVEDDNSTALSGWTGGSTNLVVPSSLNNYYISSIGDYSFEDSDKILSLDMSNAQALRKIGIGAFANCSNLSGNITIPSRVNSLGSGAFENCTGITSVNMYSGANTIPQQLFYNCSSIQNVSVGYGYSEIGKLAFANCSSLESVTISYTVTSIHPTAFNNDTNFTINCFNNSAAMQYAIDNNIDYDVIDALIGDVDGNGKINIRDVTCIQLYGIGRYDLDKHAFKRANVNRDDKVNIRDATYIQLYKVGKIASFDNLT